jgi:sensor histidine kinase YesM
MLEVPNSQISRSGVLFLGFVVVVSPIPALSLLIRGQPVPVPLALLATTPLTSGVAIFVANRWLLQRASVIVRTVVGVLMSVLVGAILAAGLMHNAGSLVTLSIPRPEVTLVKAALLGSVTALIYAGVFAMGMQFLQFLGRDERRALELRALQFESSELRARAELALLRTQLQPHFLLNTLNSVSALVGIDVKLARQTLSDLGDLLRETLEATTEHRSIENEIRWLRRYCDILSLRHGPALKIDWHVEDEARTAMVPSLLLQPLVENAIVHGALALHGKGHIRISVTSEGGWVRAEVEDDGAGPGPQRPKAIGLENLRRRLQLSAPAGTFTLEAGGLGTRAVVTWPMEAV